MLINRSGLLERFGCLLGFGSMVKMERILLKS
jgi:hypothetical protein